MNKLLALLNKYEKERKSGFTWRSIDSYDNCVYGVDCDGETEITMYSDLYSKWYGFIKWLVDNDKIDRGKIEERISGDVSLYLDNREYYGRYKWLLMLLAIQENPISFLLSVLK